MAERKVQSKYYPPDYDPRLLASLPKAGAKKKVQKEVVRLMLPFNVQCQACNGYMYRGRKFNGRKETGKDPDYMGTPVVRFHIKCENCSAPICFRTDPASSGFCMVSGGRENVTTAGMHNALAGIVDPLPEPEKLQSDALHALETRAAESKLEMDAIDALDRELDRRNAREALMQGVAGQGAAEDGVPRDAAGEHELDDAEHVRLAFEAKRRKLLENEDEQLDGRARQGDGGARSLAAGTGRDAPGPVLMVVKKKKKIALAAPAAVPNALANLLGDYGSSSEADD